MKVLLNNGVIMDVLDRVQAVVQVVQAHALMAVFKVVKTHVNTLVLAHAKEGVTTLATTLALVAVLVLHMHKL